LPKTKPATPESDQPTVEIIQPAPNLAPATPIQSVADPKLLEYYTNYYIQHYKLDPVAARAAAEKAAGDGIQSKSNQAANPPAVTAPQIPIVSQTSTVSPASDSSIPVASTQPVAEVAPQQVAQPADPKLLEYYTNYYIQYYKLDPVAARVAAEKAVNAAKPAAEAKPAATQPAAIQPVETQPALKAQPVDPVATNLNKWTGNPPAVQSAPARLAPKKFAFKPANQNSPAAGQPKLNSSAPAKPAVPKKFTAQPAQSPAVPKTFIPKLASHAVPKKSPPVQKSGYQLPKIKPKSVQPPVNTQKNKSVGRPGFKKIPSEK
jgi:hypothetical protein